ncbi:MAG: flagellar motor stator protein MotA [Alphaproteobacteria bacterium]
MFFFIGIVVVIGSILGGYLPHGSIEVLFQPLEFLIIGGAALGGFIIANPKPVLVAAAKSLGRVLKGPPHDRDSYLELLTMLYGLFKLMKAKGAMAIEKDIENFAESEFFQNHPKFCANHHAVEFLCDYLRLLTMGTDKAHEIEALMDEDIETHHSEDERVFSAVSTVADGLPAFGIVAAVLGVILTMSSITEPPEVLGGLIGAALVGTFLGVLLAYGFVGPVGNNLKAYAEADTKYYECIKAGLVAYLHGYAPAIAIEFARKTLFSEVRPSFYEVEEAIIDAA